MKLPAATTDFSVNVWPEYREHPAKNRACFDGIHSVTLNRSVSIVFVPVFEREPWPCDLPEEIDDIGTPDEARRAMVALSRYVVTVDDRRAGTAESFVDKDNESHVVFYVSAEEFGTLDEELAEVSASHRTVHDVVHVSALEGHGLVRLLVERIIPSGQLSEAELRMLGRDSRVDGAPGG